MQLFDHFLLRLIGRLHPLKQGQLAFLQLLRDRHVHGRVVEPGLHPVRVRSIVIVHGGVAIESRITVAIQLSFLNS